MGKVFRYLNGRPVFLLFLVTAALATSYVMTKQFKKAKEITFTKDRRGIAADDSMKPKPQNITEEPIETIGIKRKDIPFSTHGLTVDQFLPSKLASRVHGKGVTVLKEIKQAIAENQINKLSCEGCFMYKKNEVGNNAWTGFKEGCLEHELQPPLRDLVFEMLESSSYENVAMSNPAESSGEPILLFGFRPVKLNVMIDGEKEAHQFTLGGNRFHYSYDEDIDHSRSKKIWYSFDYSSPQYSNTRASLEDYCLPYKKEMLTKESIKSDPNLAYFYYSERIKESPNDAGALYQRGLIGLKQQSRKQAQEDFQRVLDLEPNHFGAHLGMGMVLSYKYGSLEETNTKALSFLNRALELQPEDAEVYCERGKLYRYLGDNENALKDLTKAATLKPGYAEAYFERGNLYYYYIKDPAKAIEDYSQAIESDAQYFPAYAGRARLYEKTKNYEAAIADQTKLMVKDYGNWRSAYFARAELYELTGQFDKAIEDYRSLIEEHGYRAKVEVYLKMVPICLKAGQYKEAVDVSTAILNERSPRWEQEKAYTYRAVAYYYLNEFEKSWRDIDQIVKLGKEFKYEEDPDFLSKLKNASGREK